MMVHFAIQPILTLIDQFEKKTCEPLESTLEVNLSKIYESSTICSTSSVSLAVPGGNICRNAIWPKGLSSRSNLNAVNGINLGGGRQQIDQRVWSNVTGTTWMLSSLSPSYESHIRIYIYDIIYIYMYCIYIYRYIFYYTHIWRFPLKWGGCPSYHPSRAMIQHGSFSTQAHRLGAFYGEIRPL